MRMTWVGLPMGRAQLGSVRKPKEGSFDRKDVSALCIWALLEEGKRTARGLET